jgi:predicted membrane-bound spermidine synthase
VGILYFVALLEGFTTLAVEVIAIRLAVPVVGSSIILTGIVLSIILLALSAGYWRGGIISASLPKEKLISLLRKNLLIAAILYATVSLPFFAFFLNYLLFATSNLILSIFAASITLLTLPVYFASQTLPLLTEINQGRDKAGASAGKVLFYSTIGSVFGGTCTPILLFETIGINLSIWLVSGILLICYFLIRPAGKITYTIQVLGLAAAVYIVSQMHQAFGLPNLYIFKFNNNLKLIYSKETAYNSIAIFEDLPEKWKIMEMNGSYSSGINLENKEPVFNYIKNALLAVEQSKPSRILVVGSAGFVFPQWASRKDFVNSVTAIDLDPSVYDISAKYFFQEALSDKITFIPISARFFINQKQNSKYDLAFIDAYSSRLHVPPELNTLEFFQGLSQISQHVLFNLILDKKLSSRYSRTVLATIKVAFKSLWIEDAAQDADNERSNFLVSDYQALPEMKMFNSLPESDLYTDNLNSIEFDRLAMEFH